MRLLASLFLLLFATTAVSAQASIVAKPAPEVARLMQLFIDSNQRTEKVVGWRVQILATADRQRLESVQQRFKQDYPSVPVDWVHNAPYYKLRAGAFATKQEAERLKFTLGKQFSGVYLVKDEVTESELLRMY